MDGVDSGRAGQLLAGGIVAEVAMNRFDLDVLDLCPWALREGVILRRLDVLESSRCSVWLRLGLGPAFPLGLQSV